MRWNNKIGNPSKDLEVGKINTYLLLIGVVIFIFVQCNYRTPSDVRFSKVCDIEIPKNVEIVKDEYQDMWQDYAIIYEIKLTIESQEKLIESIRKSKFYNPNIFINQGISEDMFIEIDGFRAVWAKMENGYEFANEHGRHNYYVSVDTVSRIAKFEEMYD